MATHKIPVTANQAVPNEPTMGFRCSQYRAVHVQVSQLVNVTDLTLNHYELTDDEAVDANGVPTGSSTFPATTVWPEADTLARTKTAGFHIDIPLDGVERYAPRVTDITTPGAPSLLLTLRFRSTP